MKILKYSLLFASLLLLAGVMSSCKDDEGGKGAGDATVGFAQSAYVYKESAGMVKIPIQFTGEPKKYPIVFNVEATVEGNAVALDEVARCLQLTGLRYVGDPKAPVAIEMQIIDNQEINDSRFVKLTITSASGATIQNATATIEIQDNDNNPYEKLWGNWIFKAVGLDGTPQAYDVNISGGFTPEEETENADKTLVCLGWVEPANDPKEPVWYIDYDSDTKQLSIKVGTVMTTTLKFNLPDPYSSFESKTASLDVTNEDADFDYARQIKGTWSEDLNTLTFEPTFAFCGVIFGDGQYTGYYWGGGYNIVMTRK